MASIRMIGLVVLLGLLPASALGDDVTDAIDQARKAYQAGELTNAKQALDTASQLIGQKNADRFATLLPNPLPGWKAEKARTEATGSGMFGASVASRNYSSARGETVEVQITGDSAVVMQFIPLLDNPQFASAMGKIVKIGTQRAIQSTEGDINMIVANKFLVMVLGSASPAVKLAYAQAVDVAKLSKM